jgi:nitrite transporter NirC
MYAETIQALGDQAAAKLEAQKRSLVGHLVRSMLAGMYVGAAIVLIFTVGGSLAGESVQFRRLLMGVCFGGALTIVIFAGSELFTGSNLVLTLGVLTKKARTRDLLSNWFWTYLGNLAGSVLLAFMVFRAGLLDVEAFPGVNRFVQDIFRAKTTPGPEALFWRAVLANWLVCLGVWMAARVKSESARILLIFWCMFTFITSGYEHSIANMCGLMLGLLLPNAGSHITPDLYAYNLFWATVGNIVGGAVFVAGLYWIGSPKARARAEDKVVPEANGVLANGPAVAEVQRVS